MTVRALRRRLALGAAAGLGCVVLVLAVLVARELHGTGPLDARDTLPAAASAETIRRGEYLVRAANCMACHTARGGAPGAGGRGIDTPFGVIYSTNLTPDAQTGLGRWTVLHFRRALREGRSIDGRLLWPAFPYTHYTALVDADIDAMFAWLRTLAPVEQPGRPHALRFPYGTQVALALWRVRYFRPAQWRDDPSRDAQWNRGAYLADALGHCSACHTPRNAWGAADAARPWAGGPMPGERWYAPSLVSAAEGGVAHWPQAKVVGLLRDGVVDGASVLGPMAEVVYRSTQYLSDADLQALAVFLRTLPQSPPPARSALAAPSPRVLETGGTLYSRHCADCHGAQGEGVTGSFPPLAGNRAVMLANPANLVRVILAGGFAPATAGNPRPHGMPPFSHLLNDQQTAALVTYLRASWGNRAAPVTYSDVKRYR